MDGKRSIPIAVPDTGEEEFQALREPVETGWLTQGPRVAAFEQAFARRHDVSCALATTSCTTALHLILAALGVGPGDEVVVPAFTWVATANVVLHCGATPVFADVDRATFNMDPASLARVVSPRTRAVIPVHLFGLCADMDAIAGAAQGVPLVCDAACAVGASHRGTPAGALGTASAFSFHPRKPVTTGEGGMATTTDEALAERMEQLRNHGAEISEEQRHNGPKPYLLPDFNLLGFNYRMTDLQGAVGLEQLAKLDRFMEERRAGAAFYAEALAGIPWLRLPTEPENGEHGWQAYVTMVDEDAAPMPRNEIMDRLQDMGVATRPGTHAVHTLGYYARRFGLRPDDCPQAARCARASLAIPLHNRMSRDDYEYVAASLLSLSGR